MDINREPSRQAHKKLAWHVANCMRKVTKCVEVVPSGRAMAEDVALYRNN